MSIKILVADDHELARYAIRTLLEKCQEFSNAVIEEVENGRDAVNRARQCRPDLVIMDITMPEMNGIEATRKIRQACPGTKVVILSMHNRRQYLRELIQAGISGYVLKTQVLQDVPAAARSAMAGDIYYSPKVAALLSDDYARIISGDEKNDSTSLPLGKDCFFLLCQSFFESYQHQ